MLVCLSFAPGLSGSCRWEGWPSAWLVPVKETLVRMSKDNLPSGWGYSIGSHSLE